MRSIPDDQVGSAESLPKKRVTIMAKPKLSAVEKFLGFDVVTSGEIVKIFITGTIAGFGVASMRESTHLGKAQFALYQRSTC